MTKSCKHIRKLKAVEINMRDSFIYTDHERRQYFLFGTTVTMDGAANIDPFFEVYVSEDLINFEGPYAAFQPEKGFWGVKHFWAPEVHLYKGRYYMFASFKGGIGEDRGTGILVSDAPEGPYKDHSHGAVTLKGHECLDGTLFIDEYQQPWIIFCHEWTELFYGRIAALQLKPDLSGTLTQTPLIIVDTQTDILPWIRQTTDTRVDCSGYLTDAPFMHRMKNGSLLMLWSSYSVPGYSGTGRGGYTVAITANTNGKLTDPWVHQPTLLLDDDIGHVCLFTDLSGRLMLAGHANDTKHGFEYPVFYPIEETDEGGLLVRK